MSGVLAAILLKPSPRSKPHFLAYMCAIHLIIGHLCHEPGVPGDPGITVSGVPGLPGMTVSGAPFAPGITVGGEGGVPGITVSGLLGVPAS